jgi:hypothetical protein
MTGKKANPKALLRTRWRDLFAAGCMSRLRSEGRLVALYVFYVADWTTCEARFSIRRASQCLGVHRNSVCRGVSQLIEVGILEIVTKGSPGKSTRYRIAERPQCVYQAPTSGVPERPQCVYQAPTSGGRLVHEACAPGTRAVGAAPTDGGRNSVSFSGSSFRRTSERTSTADAGAGLKPARRRRPSRLIDSPPPPAGGDAHESPAFDPGDTMTTGDDS